MKNKIKSILKYAFILITVIIAMLGLMVMSTYFIPREKIEDNIKSSITPLALGQEMKKIGTKNYYSYLHIYADEILLNIMYCADTSKPLESVVEAKYYKKTLFPNLKEAIEKESNGNTEYMRYWHGSTLIIRPLLMFFNISQIYKIFAGIFIMLIIILCIILIKKKSYLLIIAMAIGLFITKSIFVPFCLEYTWTYLIMFIAIIASIILEKKGNDKINLLMFIVGIFTCFFDFLSTETITFLVPILFIFTIRYQENRIESLKKELNNITVWIILWLLGYSLMWISKWLIASIVLHINSLDFVISKAMYRINGTPNETNSGKMIINALKLNVLTLYPISRMKKPIIAAVILIAIIIGCLLLKKKDKKYLLTGLIPICIGIIPYIRYLVIASHSRGHYMFTFRAQLTTIIAVIIAMYIIVDKNKLMKNINIRDTIRSKIQWKKR